MGRPGKSRFQRAQRARARLRSEQLFGSVPHSFVFARGRAGRSLRRLGRDLRRVMEPYTARSLQVRHKNSLRDLLAVAGPLGVSQFLVLSKSQFGINLKIFRLPGGPTLTFKVLQYSLVRDVVSALRRHRMHEGQFLHPPLLVLGNFGEPQMQLKLMAGMFQGMFPKINVHKVNLNSIRRCLLVSYDADSQHLQFRHYSVQVVPVGLSRGLRKILREKFPNLGGMDDVSQLLTGEALLSESEAEPDGPQNVLELPQNCSGRGNAVTQQSAVRLTEIGPRLTLQLVKVEEGLGQGNVLYHGLGSAAWLGWAGLQVAQVPPQVAQVPPQVAQVTPQVAQVPPQVTVTSRTPAHLRQVRRNRRTRTTPNITERSWGRSLTQICSPAAPRGREAPRAPPEPENGARKTQNSSLEPQNSNTEPQNPNLEPRNSNTEPQNLNLEPQNLNLEPQNSNTEPQNLNLEHQNSNTEPQNPNLEPQIPELEPQIPSPEPQNPDLEPQNLSLEPQNSNREPQNPNLELHIPNQEPRNSNREPQNSHLEPQNSNTEPQNLSLEPQISSPEPQIPNQEPQNSNREPQNPNLEPQNSNGEPQNLSLEPQIPDLEPQNPNQELTNLTQEPRNPNTEPQKSNQEPQILILGPQTPNPEPPNPSLEPQNPNSEPQNPNTKAPKTDLEPKNSSQELKYCTQEPQNSNPEPPKIPTWNPPKKSHPGS